MLKKLTLITCALAIAAFAVVAEDPPPPPPMPGLMVPLPDGVMPPPPEAGPEAFDAFLADVFALIDENGDGLVSLDELKAWMMKFGPKEPGEDSEPGEMAGISEGDEGLEGRPYPPECSEDVRNSELLPQGENVACGRSESVGNLLFRTVCNAAPYNTNAISLPEGRAADCFGVEAIKGHNIVFEIVEEATGTVVFDTSMGKTAFDTLVLVGGPGGTVYQIKLVSADEADARITIKFIDHPTF